MAKKASHRDKTLLRVEMTFSLQSDEFWVKKWIIEGAKKHNQSLKSSIYNKRFHSKQVAKKVFEANWQLVTQN